MPREEKFETAQAISERLGLGRTRSNKAVMWLGLNSIWALTQLRAGSYVFLSLLSFYLLRVDCSADACSSSPCCPHVRYPLSIPVALNLTSFIRHVQEALGRVFPSGVDWNRLPLKNWDEHGSP